MVLVDASVWVRFLAGREPFASGLDELLDRDEVLAHDLVEGELLIGDRGGRPALLGNYQRMLRLPAVSHSEVLAFVRARKLNGRGIGWVDAQVLASAVATHTPLWTADSRLASIAAELRIAYEA